MKIPRFISEFIPLKNSKFFSLTAVTIAFSSVIVTACILDNDNSNITTSINPDPDIPTVVEPPPLNVTGTALKCDTPETEVSTIAADLAVETPDSIQAINASKDEVNNSELKANAGNILKRLPAVVSAQTSAGILVLDPVTNLEVPVHPLLLGYAEQVTGDYELGDGSADIGDPTHLDDIFTSLSMDNGATWKKVAVGETADKSSIDVVWNSTLIPYNGHSHKPAMEIQGNNILVAWNDKYCPGSNPFDLDVVTDPDADYFMVNGKQGFIDYAGIVAPNGKTLYQVPFSCVWTARGVFVQDPENIGDPSLYGIQWRQAQQLTSGTRDSNKIWIASADVGFAITWQEDTEGLVSGMGEGPGEGYSGASTSKGTDIWYSYISMANFDDACTDVDCTASTNDPVAIAALADKPKPAVNFAYPMRITNNESCTPDDKKPYCTALKPSPDDPATLIPFNCIATVNRLKGNQSGVFVPRCVQADLDYMTEDSTIAVSPAVLDGNTGASRPVMAILKTNNDEYVTILTYEETKGLAESGHHDDSTMPTNIAQRGKAVYFESFFWDQPVEVSAGRIVNLRVPEVTIVKDDITKDVISANPTGRNIYENARRVIIAKQVDSCDGGNFTFGLMYKQGYETQGGPSDMYVRMNSGFTYNDFEATTTNVSSHDTVYDLDDKPVGSIWNETYLNDQSYDVADDNSFSPRAFLRGNEIYTAFEYTQNWRQSSNGTRPNNLWMHRYVDIGDGFKWQGPQQISLISGARVSTLDPRFMPTPKGRFATTTLESDKSNPDVLFMSYGTFDMDTGEELDLYYGRSTDKGATWEYVIDDVGSDTIPGTEDDIKHVAMLAHRDVVIEKEVQSLASPDGTLLFNAWLQETHEACIDPWCGLESRFGLVEYNFVP